MPRRVWYFSATMIAVATVATIAVASAHRPRRVWLDYSERHKALHESFERAIEDSGIAAEQMFQFRVGREPCFVMTRDKGAADLLVTIAVTRYLDGGDHYGDASARVVRRNGDVVLADSFTQTASTHAPNSELGYDIGRQPLDRVWKALCGSEL